MGWFRETPESLHMLEAERAKLAADQARYCDLTLDNLDDHTHYCDDWVDHSAGAHHCGECGLLWNPT